ncbi:tRNA1(Val) (adenine(37)-N6)-methyltransferase [Zavarzinia sp. CC-PAN008]|uniref:tRNA1(Val) (adenine(37)-N6)-methyltransferase n=1 Tax=Zavarzinia sp. CC-PAN008 TaxID=3243332 RepID=UPI003F744CCE
MDATTTRDALHDGRLHLDQPGRGYRVAVDPILLAAFVAPRGAATVLDAGSGTGAAALSLALRCPHVRVTGLERVADLRDMAVASAARAGLAERVDFVLADLAAFRASAPFDAAISNPPYYDPARSPPSPEVLRRAGSLETMPLAAWIDLMLRRLRGGGTFAMVHRAERLAEILGAVDGRCGGIDVLPVLPRAGAPASRVLLRAAKGARAPLRLLPSLVLHGADGRYTPAAQDVLRRLCPLG